MRLELLEFADVTEDVNLTSLQSQYKDVAAGLLQIRDDHLV